jgi:hypothetical protein
MGYWMIECNLVNRRCAREIFRIYRFIQTYSAIQRIGVSFQWIDNSATLFRGFLEKSFSKVSVELPRVSLSLNCEVEAKPMSLFTPDCPRSYVAPCLAHPCKTSRSGISQVRTHNHSKSTHRSFTLKQRSGRRRQDSCTCPRHPVGSCP